MINSVRYESDNCERMQFNVLNDGTSTAIEDNIAAEGGLGSESPQSPPSVTTSGSTSNIEDPLGQGNVSVLGGVFAFEL